MKINKFTKFLILNDPQDEETDKNNEIRYYKYLLDNIQNIDRNLLKYFGFDLFHDGRIKNLILNQSLNQLTFNIDGPNIRFFKDIKKSEFELIDCNYLLEFNNIVHLSIDNQKYSKFLDPLKRDMEMIYICSEINSLENEISYFNKLYKKDEKIFNSLIIHTSFGNQYITIIFDYLNVIPLEPLSYNMIQNDEHYQLPYCDKVTLKKITTAN